jgi:hypothetical protein
MSLKWATKDDFAIELPDRPGALARLSAQLQEAGVGLLGLWGDHRVDGKENFHCVPESPKQFRQWAEKEGMPVSEGMTVYLHGDDKEGALVDTLEEIATAGVSIQAIQAVVIRREFGCFIWVADEDWDALFHALD